MATGTIRVQPEEVEQLATDCTTCGADILASINILNNIIVAKQQQWEGVASTTFDQFWGQWQVAYQSVHQVLESAPPALNNWAAAMRQTDASLGLG
jgi:WXG100 family type VII secretion target